MALFPAKISGFLNDIKNSDNPTEDEKQEALKLLAKSLQDKYVYLNKTNENLDKLADELKSTRNRLQDIKEKLELATKSGLASKSIH